MKKLKYFTSDGKEVKMGDFIEVPIKVGTKEIKSRVPLIPVLMDDLIEGGVITTEEELPTSMISVQDIVVKTAKKLGTSNDPEGSMADAITFLNNLKKVSIPTFIEYVLKQASIIFNHKYPTRFKDCKEFWMFDMRTGKPFQAESYLVNTTILRTKAVFHNKQEIEAALGLLEPELRSIYGK